MHPIDLVSFLSLKQRDRETSSKFVCKKEDLAEEEGSDTTVRGQITERQTSTPEPPKERESPDETKCILRSPHEGAKMKATPDRTPGNKSTQRQRSPGAGTFSGGSLQEQKRTAAETMGSRSAQQQDSPREKKRGGDQEEKNPDRDAREA